MANNVVLPGTGETVSTDTLTTLNGASISTGEEAQRMKVTWGPAGTGTDADSATPFPVSLSAAYFVTSTVNSTTTQLASGASFVGAVESTVNQPALSWLAVSDQPLVVTISQYVDLAGTQKVKDIVRYIEAGKGFSESMVLNGDYIKFTVKNVGLATTTTLNINVGYGTIGVSDDQGNLPVIVTGSDDYSGNSLLELCVNGDLALHNKIINPELRDVNGARIPSDSPVVVKLVASTAGQQFLIDTQGYQTLGITTGTMAGTVTGNNDTSAQFQNIIGLTLSSGALVTATFAANLSYLFPCAARFIKITVTTAGWMTYTLRQLPYPLAYTTSQGVNINQINGAAVSATTAQLGTSLVNIGSAVQSSTNPLFVSPVALATTNNQTIPTINVVTATAPAATVVKAAPGKLTMLTLSNGSANAAYLHLYNATAVTLGTTASTHVYALPAAVGNYPIRLPDGGLYFSTGIAYAFTGGAASVDNTALTAPTLIANMAYI